MDILLDEVKTLESRFPHCKGSALGRNLLLVKDYDKSHTVQSKMRMLCTKCGTEFEQRPSNIFQGNLSCKCSKSYRRTRNEFISDINKAGIENNFGLVSELPSKVTTKSEADFICLCCGTSWRTKLDIILHNKIYCTMCSGKYRYSREEYIERFNSVVGDKFEIYNPPNELTRKTVICCKCRKCGAVKSCTLSSFLKDTVSCSNCRDMTINRYGDIQYLYLVKILTEEGCFYKIGITYNLERRFKELSSYNTGTLVPLQTWEYSNRHDVEEHERVLKRMFCYREDKLEDGKTEAVTFESMPIICCIQGLQYRRRGGYTS